ncbi:MAG TPA: PAS domain S-box protein, partial [Rubrobacteraceae bacterium]|nr:PAS domain S-box protein [Rubrobacteraceae bacterium]
MGHMRAASLGGAGGLLPIAIGFAALLWIVDSLMDALFFDKDGFINALLSTDLDELWNRIVIVTVLVLFAIVAQRIINRRRETENKLRESEERFRGLSKASFEGIAISEAGKLLEVNDAFAAIFGYERQEMAGMDALEIVAPESREVVRHNIASGYDNSYEAIGLRKDGSRFDIEGHGKTSTYRDHSVRVTAVRDITERKRTEEALKESEERLRLAMEAGMLGTWYLDLRSGEFIASIQAKAMHGLPPENPLDNQGAIEAVHPDDRAEVASKIERTISERVPYEAEYRIVWPDGGIRWLRARGRVHGLTEDGGGERLIGVVRDITEGKRAEEELRKSEARARAITETAIDAIITMTADGLIQSFNPAAERVFGYTAEEAVGQPLRMLMPERFRGSHERGFREYLGGREAHVMGKGAVELAGLRKDGIEFPLELSLGEMREGGDALFTGIIRDITGRKRSGRRLEAQYAATRVLGESATLEEASLKILRIVCENLDWEVGEIWEIDQEADVLRCARHWCVPDVDVSALADDLRCRSFARGDGLPGRVWAAGDPVWIPDVSKEASFVRADIAAGAGLHAAFASPILLRGEVLGVMCFLGRAVREPDEAVLDMMDTIGTQIGQFIERRRAEKEVREAEERFRSAFDDAAIGMGLNSPDGRFLRVNRALCEMLGRPEEELLSLTFADITHPDDVDTSREQVRRLLDGETDGYRMEKRYLHADGSVVWVALSVSGIRDAEGRARYLAAQMQDITERKAAEERLAASEAELRALFAAMTDVILVLDN